MNTIQCSGEQALVPDEATVPSLLADYIATRGKPVTEFTRCSGCLEHQAVASVGVNDYCMPCWTGMHGYDIAELAIVSAVLGAAIRGALDTGVSEELVRQIVEDALVEVPA